MMDPVVRYTLFFVVALAFLAMVAVEVLGLLGICHVPQSFLTYAQPIMGGTLLGAFISVFKKEFLSASKVLPVKRAIVGYWWQMDRNEEFPISFIRIVSDDGSVALRGTSYTTSGRERAEWETTSVQIVAPNTIHYFWSGANRMDDGKPEVIGVGIVSFDVSPTQDCVSGRGWFTPNHLFDPGNEVQKIVMVRLKKAEAVIMKGDDGEAKSSTAIAAYGKWKATISADG